MPSLIASGGHRKELTGESCTVGSAAGSGITVRAELGVAPNHFRLDKSIAGWQVKPLSGSEPTLVNGKSIVRATLLSNGDAIRAGELALQFEGESLDDLKGLAAAIAKAEAQEAAKASREPTIRRLKAVGCITAVLMPWVAFAAWKSGAFAEPPAPIAKAPPVEQEPAEAVPPSSPVPASRTLDSGAVVNGVQWNGKFYDYVPMGSDPTLAEQMRLVLAENTRAEALSDYEAAEVGSVERTELRDQLNLATAHSLSIAASALSLRSGRPPGTLMELTAHLRTGLSIDYITEAGDEEPWTYLPENLSTEDAIVLLAPRAEQSGRIALRSQEEPVLLGEQEAAETLEMIGLVNDSAPQETADANSN